MKYLIQLYICWLLLTLISISACYYDSEEELYGTTECMTEDMSYQIDILPIIQNSCYKCHDAANNFGGITLEGYDNLKRFADNGELVGAVTHTSGFSPMPKNEPQLPQCEVEKIEAWVLNGALNN